MDTYSTTNKNNQTSFKNEALFMEHSKKKLKALNSVMIG